MSPRRTAGAVMAVLAMAGGVAAWTGELPRWTLSGTRMVLSPSLALGSAKLAIPAQGQILFVGDSNTGGTRIGGPAHAYPAFFAERLGLASRTRVHAFGGATVADVLGRPLPADRPTLAFVMLGSNDAATRGSLSRKISVPLNNYRQNLQELVAVLKRHGAQVVILAPPPVGSLAMSRRLSPYREAARTAALASEAAFLDSADAFRQSEGAARLQFDALHLSPEAQRELGLWLAAQTTRASAAGNSSTGKPKPSSASQPS